LRTRDEGREVAMKRVLKWWASWGECLKDIAVIGVPIIVVLPLGFYSILAH
jgi:hypothetical protein